MTTSCLHTHINDIQCKYGELAYKNAIALSQGRVCTERNTSIKLLDAWLGILYCYKTFDADVTYAYRFDIAKVGLETVTITISIGGEDFTYTGDGETVEINNYFENLIPQNTTYVFQAFIHSEQLYVYSYDTSLDFNTTTTITSTIPYTVELNNEEDSYNDFLNIWNCVCEECICNIIKAAGKIAGNCNC